MLRKLKVNCIYNMIVVCFIILAFPNQNVYSISQKGLIKEIIILEMESIKFNLLKKNIIEFNSFNDYSPEEMSNKINHVRYKKKINEYQINISNFNLFDSDSICKGFKYYFGFHSSTQFGANAFQYSPERMEFLIAMNKSNYFYVLQSPISNDPKDFFKNEIKEIMDKNTATLLARGYSKIISKDISHVIIIDDLNFNDYSIELSVKPYTKEIENGFEVLLYCNNHSNKDNVDDLISLKLRIEKDCTITEIEKKEIKIH